MFWLILAPLIALTAANCPPGYVYYGGTNRCFLFEYGQHFSWSDAQKECQKTGGNLASIRNSEENQYLSDVYAASLEDYYPWIGLTRPISSDPLQPYNANWYWIDGSNSTFRKFDAEYGHSHNATYAVLNGDEYTWDGLWAANLQPYICSVDPVFDPSCQSRTSCETGWTYFTESNSCFKTFFNQDFKGAENVCKGYGAHLASINSDLENDFVGGLAETGIRQDEMRQIWIGVTLNGTHWVHVDGTKMEYYNFGKGMPDNATGSENCVQMFADPWSQKLGYQNRWNDFNCDIVIRAFVCKKSAF